MGGDCLIVLALIILTFVIGGGGKLSKIGKCTMGKKIFLRQRIKLHMVAPASSKTDNDTHPISDIGPMHKIVGLWIMNLNGSIFRFIVKTTKYCEQLINY